MIRGSSAPRLRPVSDPRRKKSAEAPLAKYSIEDERRRRSFELARRKRPLDIRFFVSHGPVPVIERGIRLPLDVWFLSQTPGSMIRRLFPPLEAYFLSRYENIRDVLLHWKNEWLPGPDVRASKQQAARERAAVMGQELDCRLADSYPAGKRDLRPVRRAHIERVLQALKSELSTLAAEAELARFSQEAQREAIDPVTGARGVHFLTHDHPDSRAAVAAEDLLLYNLFLAYTNPPRFFTFKCPRLYPAYFRNLNHPDCLLQTVWTWGRDVLRNRKVKRACDSASPKLRKQIAAIIRSWRKRRRAFDEGRRRGRKDDKPRKRRGGSAPLGPTILDMLQQAADGELPTQSRADLVEELRDCGYSVSDETLNSFARAELGRRR